MIHGLFVAEFGNGRKDAEGIASEENNIGGVTADAGDLSVLDELDGVGSAGVLSK